MSQSARRKANRAAQQRKGKVMLGYIHPPDYPAMFGNSGIAFALWDSRNHQDWAGEGDGILAAFESSPRIASARNRLVRTFLSTDAEWLWMVDADMVYPPNQLHRLLEHADPIERPIIAGLYFVGGRGATHEPAIYDFVTLEDGRRSAVRRDEFPENELIECDGTGAGMFLCHRSVYETVGEAFKASRFTWFMEAELDEEEVGEDITFWMRVKALGMQLRLHTGIVALHQKRTLLGIRSWEKQKKEIAEAGGETALWEEYARERGGELV